MTIVEQTKKLLVDYMLRPLYEAAGNPRFSRPALYDLDVKLAQYLNFRGGIFVELGANDGFTQSNTYYLEKFLGWRRECLPPLAQPVMPRSVGANIGDWSAAVVALKATTVFHSGLCSQMHDHFSSSVAMRFDVGNSRVQIVNQRGSAQHLVRRN
jgi:hypothetical protein